MNIKDSHYENRLERFLQTLNLTDHNLQLARSYLSDPEAGEELLKTAEHQDFSPTHGLNPELHDLSESAKSQQMGHVLKFLWAVGGRTAVRPLGFFCGRLVPGESSRWRAKYLGNTAAIVFEAALFGSYQFNAETVRWLMEMAGSEEGAVLDALGQLGPMDEGLKLLLCALLVRYSFDGEVVARLMAGAKRLLESGMHTMLDHTPKAEIGELTEYVFRGDSTAAPPVPASVKFPCVDALSAQYPNYALDNWTLGRLSLPALLIAKKDPMGIRMLKTMMMLSGNLVLAALTNWCPKEQLLEDAPILQEVTPGGGAGMLMFLSSERVYYGVRSAMSDLAACYAADLVRAKQEADCLIYVNLLKMNPTPLPREEVREKIIVDLCRRVESGADDLRGWLLGERDALGPVTLGPSPNPLGAVLLLRELIVTQGWDDFLVRCVKAVLEVFSGRSMGKMLYDGNRQLMPGMICGLTEKLLGAGVSVALLLDIFAQEYENIYSEEDKRTIRDTAAEAVAKPEYIEGLSVAAAKCGLMGRWAAITALNALADEHASAKAGVLAAAGDSSKQIRELVMSIFTARKEWAADFEVLLNAKKTAVRLVAVEALAKHGIREPLEKALEIEKNAKVADAIRAVLGAEAPAAGGSIVEQATELTKGSKLKKLSWLLTDDLPKLRRNDGSRAEDVIRDAIVLSYCELGRVGRSDTAAKFSEDLDKADLQKLACEVYERWFSAGAQAKHKWVLSFAAVFGGTAMTPRLQRAIHDWPEHQRGAIACDAVMALALSTDPAAIVIVDGLSRKFKFRQVNQAAAQALENAARELGITAEELADRIVPDLGFGKDGKRTFDYGKRSFTVSLTPTLELQIVNDQGKTVKSMPAPGKTDDAIAADAYEAFKTMKKQIKATVTAQRARLESALSAARFWDTERWQSLFVENPIMHQFAMSLIWGVYEDGKLTDTFRYMEDGSFNTVDEEEYALPGKALIGLVHPVELDEDTLEGWKQQLEDYEITQSVDQLSRQVFVLDESRAGEKVLEDFGGKKLNGLSLSGKLLGQGWYRGSVQDGGVFYCFYREDPTVGMGAELRFSGSAVGFDDGDPVTVYDAVFYTGSINRGSYVYDKIPEENLVELGKVPARYYSEILLHLTKATASSTETDKEWKKDRLDS